MNFHLKFMLDELCIPSAEQEKLGTAHGIVNYDTLKAKQYHLDRRDLEGVDPAVQRIVATALRFLKSLNQEDPIPMFTKKAWSEFATTPDSLGTKGHHQAGGAGEDSSGSDLHLGKIVFDSDPDEQQPWNETKSNGDAMEVDEIESIESGEEDYLMVGKSSRATVEKEGDGSSNEKVGSDDENEGELITETLGTFDVMPQGFNPSEANPFAVVLEKTVEEDDLEVNDVLFKGRTLSKGNCYHYTSANDEAYIVGIKTFKMKSSASCVRIEHISKSFLGYNDTGEFQNAVAENYPNLFAQFGRPRTIALSDLGEECNEPSEIPKLIYEPQMPGAMTSLAYIHDNSDRKRVQLRQETIRLLEGFSGCGGMHIGFSEEGFETACAIEMNEIAVKTFTHNNPDVPTYCGDIREFMRSYEENEEYRESVGQVESLHLSPPCQGFSKANRSGGANDDENNSLSLLFPRLLKMTNARVGTFENVPGMWSQKGISYLRNVLIDCIALGYQVRVKVLYASDYGDPQKRARLIIIAAKNDAPMPDHPTPTHGDRYGLKPFVYPKDVLEYYRTDEGKACPNMDSMSQSNLDSAKEVFKLRARGFAPVIKASGAPVVHYDEDRCITIREAAALQSFPADYEFLGTVSEQKRQVGNAVPTGLSRAIARSVRDSFRYHYADVDDL